MEKEADPSDPQEYFNMRVRMIEGRRAEGKSEFVNLETVDIHEYKCRSVPAQVQRVDLVDGLHREVQGREE